IMKNIEYKIENFGMFTKNRVIYDEKIYATFGTTEILSSCLRRGFLDAVVIVADCAGSVIASDPKLVQGLGGRVSGIIKTSPILEVIEKIEKAGGIVVNKNAEINQIKGVKMAIDSGFKRIGVTLTSVEDAKICKELEDNTVKILTIAVHTTGVNWSREEILYFDLVNLCASKTLRENIVGIAKAQAGKKIPIVAISDFGKEALLERAKDLDQFLLTLEKIPLRDVEEPYPLI
ncbi:MAG: DUF2099 family protein, partial [Candidatus Korarchaeum sp.]|nr:DUF2099 family protein [Candidatus Korarchaeum sp.]